MICFLLDKRIYTFVINVIGFYEWKTFKDQTKQPYLIYAKQKCIKCQEGNDEGTNKHCCYLKSQKLENLSDNWNEDHEWIGISIFKLPL